MECCMPSNIFITGVPKSGKTTLLTKLAADLSNMGMTVGGFVSPDERHSGTRTAFYAKDIRTGKTAILADVKGDGPKVKKYHVNVKSFESICLNALNDYQNCDVIVIDEIGTMESKSKKFLDLLDKILDSKIPLLAALHNDLTDKYGLTGEVLYLTDDNRGEVYEELLEKIKSIRKNPAKVVVKKEKKQSKIVEKQSKKIKQETSIEQEAPKKKGIIDKIRELLGI